MLLAQKLNLKAQKVAVLNAPKGFTLDAPATKAPKPGDAVLLFVQDMAELQKHKGPVVAAATRDDLAWVAYPKAGQLGTDLNRDVVHDALLADGIQAVRNIAIDEVWSALRFRPS
ncbi:MAG: hypothetical protein QOD77_1676 [Thermoplasmata archaeon]|jgi:hypothetical protein|nr:hypothetical protein [Thermoplasmata archaeon]